MSGAVVSYKNVTKVSFPIKGAWCTTYVDKFFEREDDANQFITKQIDLRNKTHMLQTIAPWEYVKIPHFLVLEYNGELFPIGNAIKMSVSNDAAC
jgi:hypothetical protein